MPDILGVGLPTLAVILYAAALLWERIQRQRAGLRTKSPLQIGLKIGLVVVIVE